ncbi:MAG: DUF5009 domain-containing protein [Acidobacteriota bacterium]
MSEATEVPPADSISSTVAPQPPPRERLVALDAFRGITIAGMLLVNNPGSWTFIYPPLEHAEWNGWTPTDLIFPFFLFIVGITTQMSLTARRERGATDRELTLQILRRGSVIVLCGLFLASFPFYTWGTIASIPDATILQRVAYRFAHLRFPGVLQRIGVVYIISALIALRTSARQQAAILVTVLLSYWALMTLVRVPDSGLLGAEVLDKPEMVLSAWLDRLVFGPHLWVSTKTWDPEGILSTLPAIGTAMLGGFTAMWLRTSRPLTDRLAGLYAAGSLTMVAGLIWNWVFPINKNLWSSSYVLFTAGMGALTLATCLWLIDVRNLRRWARPFVIYGTNPLIAFVGSGIMARLIYSMIKVPLEGKRVALATWVNRTAFASWLPPRAASLAFAISFVLFWLGILTVLHRKNIVIKA